MIQMMFRQKRQLSLLLFIWMWVLFVSGCQTGDVKNEKITNGTKEEQQKPPRKNDQSIKIGFSMDTLLEERWQKDRDLLQTALENLGAKMEVFAANGNDLLQITQAETLLRNGVDVLIVTPHNAEVMAAVVKKAHDVNVKVIAYDRLIKNANVDLYISFDNERIGELQATAILQKVPQGNFVYIGGAETDNNAHLLKKGVFSILQPHIASGAITVVYDEWTQDWSPRQAEENMRAALQLNDQQIDAVICANDATAGAVLKAIEEVGLLGKIPVAGQDAELTAIQRVVQGKQTMTVYKPIITLAEQAAKMAVQLARGEPIQTDAFMNNGKIEVPSVLLKPTAVTIENIEQTVIADGFHPREKIYPVD